MEIVLIALIVIVVLVGIVLVGMYNGLVRSRLQVREA